MIGSMEDKSAAPTMELLEGSECWSLLRKVSVGRLAVWHGDGPDIFPINYTTDHGTVIFRTGAGTKLEAALSEFPVAMEADGISPETGKAWSVVIRGQAELMTKTEEVLGTFSLPLFPWQEGRKDHFVRLVPDSISGRRFKITPLSTWGIPSESGKNSAVE